MEPEDYALLGILIIGIIMALIIFKELKENKRGFLFFIIGICFSIIAVFDDSMNLRGMDINIQKMVQYGEEMLETCGMLCFLNSVVTVMLDEKNRIEK